MFSSDFFFVLSLLVHQDVLRVLGAMLDVDDGSTDTTESAM